MSKLIFVLCPRICVRRDGRDAVASRVVTPLLDAMNGDDHPRQLVDQTILLLWGEHPEVGLFPTMEAYRPLISLPNGLLYDHTFYDSPLPVTREQALGQTEGLRVGHQADRALLWFGGDVTPTDFLHARHGVMLHDGLNRRASRHGAIALIEPKGV